MGCACGIGYGASTEYLMGGVMMGIKMSTWPMTAFVLVLLLAVVSARQLLNQSESIFAAARPGFRCRDATKVRRIAPPQCRLEGLFKTCHLAG